MPGKGYGMKREHEPARDSVRAGETGATEIAGAAPAARGVLVLSLVTALSLVGGYALHMVAARHLVKADYGRFVLILSIVTWVESFQGAALTGVGKVLSEDHRRLSAAFAVARAWFLPSGVIGGLILLAAAPWIAAGLGDEALAGLLVLAAVEVPLTALFRMTARFSGVMRRYATSSLIQSLYVLGRTVLGCALILFGFGVMGGILGQVLATALAAGVGLWLLLRAGRGLPRVDYPEMRRRSLAWVGYSVAFSMGTSTLLAIDIWCVRGLLDDAEQVGLYGVAFVLARTPKFLMQAIDGAIFPRVSQALAQGRKSLAAAVATDAYRTLLIVLIPLCLLVGESATAILTFLFSERYAAAGRLLAILMVAISLYALFQLMLVLLAAADRPGVRTAFALGLLPLGLGLNFLLIPPFGITGAGVATLLTMLVGVLALAPMVRRCIGAFPPVRTLARCGLAGGLVFGAARFWPAEGWALIPRLAVLGAGYVGLLWGLGELADKDFRSLFRAIPRRAGGRRKRGFS